MKKLLSVLGTITIAGSGTAGLLGNAPAKNAINYQQTNHLETLKRNKRSTINLNLNVNKIRQIHNWNCAPTSAESVLRYFGISRIQPSPIEIESHNNNSLQDILMFRFGTTPPIYDTNGRLIGGPLESRYLMD